MVEILDIAIIRLASARDQEDDPEEMRLSCSAKMNSDMHRFEDDRSGGTLMADIA